MMMRWLIIFLCLCCIPGCGDDGSNNTDSEEPVVSDDVLLPLNWQRIDYTQSIAADIKAFIVAKDDAQKITLLADPVEDIGNAYFVVHFSTNGGKSWERIDATHTNYAPNRFGEGERITRIIPTISDNSEFYFVTHPIEPVGHAGIQQLPPVLRQYVLGELSSTIIHAGESRTRYGISDGTQQWLFVSETMASFGGPSELKRSEDFGQTFTNLSEPFPRWVIMPDDETTSGCEMRLMSVTETAELVVKCEGLHYSDDAGDHWVEIENLPDEVARPRPICQFHLSSIENRVGYAYYFSDENSWMYRVDIDRNTWTEIQLPDTPQSLQISSLSAETLFLSSGTAGVFSSMDSGSTWVAHNEGLEDVSVLEVQVVDGTFYARTDSGIYRSN